MHTRGRKSGQEYVNVYAQQAKERLQAGEPGPAAGPLPTGETAHEEPQDEPPATDSSMLTIAPLVFTGAALQDPH